jgi:RHS repeat-associated protein
VHPKKKLKGESGIEAFEVRAASDPLTVALQLMQNPSVEFAEPNFVVKSDQLESSSNDPRLSEQWALNNVGQNGGQYGSDINAVSAWQRTQGSTTTVVAVIDSGIDFNHPDLLNNQWTNPTATNGDLHGWDFVTDDGTIKDEQGHGTGVAGIIAAQGNNGVGVSGVMWRASLMSLRVLDETGTGDVANAVEAIDYAAAHGAQIINLSWGTEAYSIALKDAIDRALRRGVIVVCSAGNSGRNLDEISSAYYPASFDSPDLISVAGTDNRDQLASWSNFGGTRIAVAAPGENILTTQMGGSYWNVSGTSAAAPLVSGVLGLMKTLRPAVNARQAKKAIIDSARQTASLAGRVASSGVVDAVKAIRGLPGLEDRNNRRQLPAQRYGSGGTGPGGSFNTTPPPVTTGAPASDLQNLDQVRNAKPEPPKAKAPIQSNLMCADCDPLSGGGGGSYYPSNDPNFSTARLRPTNETGQNGVDLGSRNFNWGVNLLHLAGRAGLDLDLTLFANSLVWTKDGGYIKYNADHGWPAPGFHLGLPVLQQGFYDSQTGQWSYELVTSSGGRIELRPTATANIYESADSTYAQLDVTNASAPVLRTTDGTQMTFAASVNNEYRCIQVKDRNGNYISASYDGNGHSTVITDTLGRGITFVYDGNGNVQAIRQTWNGVAHDWATFYYGQVYVAPSFGGGLLVNGPNNNYVTVLTQVNLHDGTYYTFNYNAAFGQLNRINHYAADGHLREYTSYNVDSSAGQTDCPRFTERHDWAENWNNNNEAITYYSVAADGSWTQETTPDSTIYKEFFAISGWQNGLTTSTEVWSGGVKKKWTATSWTQDDTSLSYAKNPRAYDTSIYDEAGNRRRSEIVYTTYYWPNAISLPTEIREYAADATTILRKTTNTYFISQPYIDRRVLGLLRETIVYDENNQPVSKLWYDYDWGNDYWAATPQNAVQHENSTDYTGRGNLCWIGRWDVSDVNNFDKSTRAYFKYNNTGSLIASYDTYWHGKTISYTDSFSDSVNRNTFAYPTSLTDEDNFVSSAQYNFDIGAVTRTQDPKGAIQTMTYDAAGRTDRVTLTNNGAYTRYVYNPYGDIDSFSTINDGAGEVFGVTYFDGAGRLRASGGDLPNSSGGYRGQFWIYDNMGRLSQQSNPAEMNSSWAPSGDDAAGWVWTYQNYDWKGRPTVTTLPDGATREDTYGGCGCAGGEVTTVRDERGRRRKFTKDVLGRLKQVDELNWDQSVYSTTTYSYNARDQITQSNQAGQIRSFVYDGFGRLQTRTTPEQGTSTLSYFADDTTQTVTDARGATTTFAYNNRHLPTSITYNVTGDPTGRTATTPNVAFAYDEAGNRTSMTDGQGSATYSYNALSQMTSETRTFTGIGSFTLSYAYNLSGELTNITNPWNAQVGYSYDKTGRATSMSGANYAGVSSYVNSIAYRAFGAAKQVSYSNGRTLSMQYDNRLRATRWDVPGVMGWSYAYNYFNENSGRVTYAQNLYDATLDRSYDYDHVGRLLEAHTGSEARGALVGTGGTQDGSYSHSYRYDQFGNMWYRVGWGGSFGSWLEENPSYTNNQRNGLSYDAAGNLFGNSTVTYDATGQQISYSGGPTQSYDGDRLRVKKIEGGTTTYYLRSTVLSGQVVAELDGSGGFSRGYVYAGGQMIAIQNNNSVSWVHQDPVTKSQRITNSSGTVTSTVDLDPWGGDTSRSSNAAFQPHRYTTYTRDADGGDDAMMRRYGNYWARFSQPDPWDGSYEPNDPQTLNRYAYTQNDPINLTDPTGLGTCHDSHGNTFPCSDEDEQWQKDNPGSVSGAVRISTIDSLLGNYYLPASMSGHSPMVIGLLQGDPNVITPTISPVDRHTPQQNPTQQTNAGADVKTCDIYTKAGRPDLALLCRLFGDGPRTNPYRQCLQSNFYGPSGQQKRGQYFEFDPLNGLSGGLAVPSYGPGTHLACLSVLF